MIQNKTEMITVKSTETSFPPVSLQYSISLLFFHMIYLTFFFFVLLSFSFHADFLSMIVALTLE
uniref:Uncharacterized protein n=1 Tax=Thermosporothrix sp. COM3 TaxID=2490863 RepID=A0A455SBD1_9CHLR|nr:hypothetical protein KTC_05240 [Thermosporothrix sp. COM3]